MVGTETNLTFTACDQFKSTLIGGQLCYSFGALHDDESKPGRDNSVLLALDPGSSTLAGEQLEASIYLSTLSPFTDNKAGKYALSSLKKISGTENFMNLDKRVKKCQEQTYENCQTAKTLQALQEKCSCLPFELKNVLEVQVACMIYSTILPLLG